MSAAWAWIRWLGAGRIGRFAPAFAGAGVGGRLWHAKGVDIGELDRIVPAWLSLPEVADHLGIDLAGVRRLIDDSELVAVRRSGGGVGRSVPTALVDPELVVGLPGTVTLLRDSGYTDVELLGWLFTPQDDGASPLELMRAGRKTEVRRRAQLLAF